MDYIPPYPKRHLDGLTILDLLRKGRENLLSIWTENDFKQDVIQAKILNQYIIIANSPETVRYAFVTASASFERKSRLMRRALQPLVGDGLFISDGETWRARRVIVGSVIHGSRIPYFAPLMIEAMLELRERWTRQARNSSKNIAIDMLSEMAQLTAEVISRAIFGRQLGCEHARDIAEGFSKYQTSIGAFNLLPLIGCPDSITYLFMLGMRRSAKRITKVLDYLVAEHFISRSEAEASVLAALATDTHNLKALTKKQIRNEAAVLFMAGHETTANCLAWAWFLLSQKIECAQRLHAEIDAVLAGRIPTFSDVSQLIYTRAVIEETLRLYPPIPILSRQAVQVEKLEQYQVPKGAIVAVVPWLLHRHKSYWNKPDHFIPERFLPDQPIPIKYSYIPFSIGPRVCAGMNFGLTEAILGLAVLSQTLHFQLIPGTVIQPVSHLSLRPDDGAGKLPMYITIRGL